MKAVWGCGLLLVWLSGCATYPKAHDGTLIEVERGYWASYTQFKQRGKRVDRASAKEVLAEHEESAPAVKRGAALDVMTGLTAVVSGTLLGLGLGGLANKDSGISPSTSSWLLLGGGLSLGASVAFGFGAEGSYISAVQSYNQPATPSP
jgi:F0F1-type ATP synthase assembly protein I